MRRDAKFSVVCLGTGKGHSMVYDGCCSPAYVLCVDDSPFILFGAGYGVTRQCLRYFDVIPPNIFIFSNRSHMSAELPVIIAVESRKGRRLRIIASEMVMSRLREHRLSEVRSRIDEMRAANNDEVCDFVPLPSHNVPVVGNSTPYRLSGVAAVSLIVFDTPATEASCGVVVLHNDIPLVVITGDCAYNARLHQYILSMAPVVILDGRRKSSRDHAGFADILHAAENCKVMPKRVFIGQYGQPWEAPPVEKGSVVFPIVEGAVVLRVGEKIAITYASAAAAAAAAEVVTEKSKTLEREEEDPIMLTRSRNGDTTTHSGLPPRRVFVVNNESPDDPPALLMVQQFRTMTQVKQRISKLLDLRPVGNLFSLETGQKLRSLSQLTHGMRVVATKIGGMPFDGLPFAHEKKTQRISILHTIPLKETSSVSVELNDYMQRAYQALERSAEYEELIPAAASKYSVDVDAFDDANSDNLVSGNGNHGEGVDCSSDISASVCSEIYPSAEHLGQLPRVESNSGTIPCSLRYTTLGI